MCSKPDISTVLDSIEHDQLITFIVEYAKSDEKFLNELYVTFGEPDFGAEMEGIKVRIADVIRQGTRSGFIDYRGCDYICNEMDQILEQAQKRLNQGHPVIAFGIAMQICLKGYWLASRADSSSGSLTITINSSLEMIDKASANAIAEADRKFIYEKCCKEAKNKVFEGWNEGNYAFLRSCARFVTKRNAKKIFDTLDYLAEKLRTDSFSYTTDDKLTRLEICKHLDGEDEYERQIKINLDIKEVRRIAVDRALANNNYAYAETLCLEYINTATSGYHWMREWFDTLFDIYVRTDNKTRQEEVASRLLFTAHDEKYYDILKSLLIGRGVWEAEYSNILYQCATNLAPTEYMRVLQKEGEKRLLLKEVSLIPTNVLTYGSYLADEYPPETYALFREVITTQAAEATDRNKYGRVCANLQKFYDAGGIDETLNLIEDLRSKYKRRLAMIDELNKLEKKLRKAKM